MYDLLEMKRLGSFYRRISAGRIFQLIKKKLLPTNDIWEHDGDVYRSCLINRCVKNMLDNYEMMKLKQQIKPILVDTSEVRIYNRGFPRAKKQMILQTIDMFRFLGNFNETTK